MKPVLILLLLTSSAPAAAQTGKAAVSGGAVLLSDYRFRGISRSGGDPALQGRITVTLPGGLYAGARGTTLKGVRALGDAELDLYAGYSASIASGTTIDAGLLYYTFPGGAAGSDQAEPYVSLSHTLGPVEASVGAKYALGGDEHAYVFGQIEAGIPLTGLTLVAEAGREEGGRLGGYWNWSRGGRYAIGPIEAGLRYVDPALGPAPAPVPRRRSGAGLVGSLGIRF